MKPATQGSAAWRRWTGLTVEVDSEAAATSTKQELSRRANTDRRETRMIREHVLSVNIKSVGVAAKIAAAHHVGGKIRMSQAPPPDRASLSFFCQPMLRGLTASIRGLTMQTKRIKGDLVRTT